MHCRDLNPYVESALVDWRKSHRKQGQLPRAAAGMACGSSPCAAGMSLCSPYALIAPAIEVHTLSCIHGDVRKSTRLQLQTGLFCQLSSARPATATGTSSFGMSGVNAHAIFAPPATGSAAGERVAGGHFVRHQHWPVVTARHLLGPARAGGRGQLVFACSLRSQELSYLWDHKVLVSALTVLKIHRLHTCEHTFLVWMNRTLFEPIRHCAVQSNLQLQPGQALAHNLAS